ncbi:MAG: TasA family protein [Clostridia bacterium]|nr:TasA family protein [Clostridia bacterium]MDY2929598.1 TasA family protein [Clostridiaceae bacterium]
MKSNKTVRKALWMSVLSIALCLTMLVGTTFAWFTDTATTGVNKIQAGTLDVVMSSDEAGKNSLEGKTLNWVKAEGAAANEAVLWEPGCTYNLDSFYIVNKGNLALKYKVVISGVDGSSKLMKAIDFTITEEGKEPVDLAAWNGGVLLPSTATAEVGGAKIGHTGKLTITGKMRTDAGNEYQGLSIDGVGITVYATQYTYESDSKDNTYDESAEKDEFKQGVKIGGIAGVAESYDTIQEAYEAVKAMLVANSGLAEQPLSEEAFNAFFTNGGKITWTIYGNQKVTDNRMFSFGRAANRFGEGRHIVEIDIIGGNSTATLDLSDVNGTFALPYNWWNVADSANTTLKCKNIIFHGIKYMPSATYQCTLHQTAYEFDGCTFNGNLYSYQNFDVDMTIKNCTFNAPANTQYAFMSQGAGGKITLDNNTFNNYTRGINLQRAAADFVVTNNTIQSTCSEADRGAIQLTDGKSFVVTGNTVDVNAGNAFWFHDAATNADVTYTISNNDIKAPYLGYSGVTAFDVNGKITSSGNKFNSTDATKCMKKGATVAEATNLTAIK